MAMPAIHSDLLDAQLGRQPRDDVHVGIEDLEAEQPLEERRDGAGVVRRCRQPSSTPSATPNQAMTLPWIRNTAITRRGEVPSVRRIAMSVRLSVTTMASIATR